MLKLFRFSSKTLSSDDGFLISEQLRCVGGGERDRTDDLLRARQALSQLSYTPIFAQRVSYQ